MALPPLAPCWQYFCCRLFCPASSESLLGTQPKAFWYMARASAFVALGLLWLSTASGILITNKLARIWPGGPTAFAWHEYTSLLALAIAAFHALILIGDRFINYTLVQLVLPFGSVNYRPTWVGLGQVSFYLLAVVTLSFYARRIITHKTWRFIHFLSFALFVMVLAHGILSGTDSATPWAQAVYWFAAGSTVFLTAYRVLSKRVT